MIIWQSFLTGSWIAKRDRAGQKYKQYSRKCVAGCLERYGEELE